MYTLCLTHGHVCSSLPTTTDLQSANVGEQLRDALVAEANSQALALQSKARAEAEERAAAEARAAAAAQAQQERLTISVDVNINVPFSYTEGQDAAQVRLRCDYCAFRRGLVLTAIVSLTLLTAETRLHAPSATSTASTPTTTSPRSSSCCAAKLLKKLVLVRQPPTLQVRVPHSFLQMHLCVFQRQTLVLELAASHLLTCMLCATRTAAAAQAARVPVLTVPLTIGGNRVQINLYDGDVITDVAKNVCAELNSNEAYPQLVKVLQERVSAL